MLAVLQLGLIPSAINRTHTINLSDIRVQTNTAQFIAGRLTVIIMFNARYVYKSFSDPSSYLILRADLRMLGRHEATACLDGMAVPVAPSGVSTGEVYRGWTHMLKAD